MNRKGLLIHWLALATLLALGVFFFFLSTEFKDVKKSVPGEWQANFLHDLYFQAQIDLLTIDQKATKIGLETAKEMALKGGFETESPCGVIKSKNLWNEKDRLCFPDVVANANRVAEQKIVQTFPTGGYTEVELEGKHFSAKGKIKTITAGTGSYTYETSFARILPYSFDEYKELYKDMMLLLACRAQRDLENCVKNTKTEFSWRFESCTEERSFPVTTRVVDFCVRSKSDQKVEYFVGLDFRPLQPFAVENVETTISSTHTPEIRFMYDLNVEQYTVYYTAWPVQCRSLPATVAELFADVETVSKNVVPLPRIDCPAHKE